MPEDMGGLDFKVAGGDASKYSLLTVDLVWPDLDEGFGSWVDGGGVMVPVSLTGESRRTMLLLIALEELVGLAEGVISLRRIECSGLGVRGAVSSDIFPCEGFLLPCSLVLRALLSELRPRLKRLKCRGYIHKNGANAAWLGKGCTTSGGVIRDCGSEAKKSFSTSSEVYDRYASSPEGLVEELLTSSSECREGLGARESSSHLQGQNHLT